MSGPVLIDTGPLVALIDRREKHHGWAVAQAERFSPPFITSEAVITEACFLVRHVAGGATAVLEFVIRIASHPVSVAKRSHCNRTAYAALY
jgi:uncharacterized protein